MKKLLTVLLVGLLVLMSGCHVQKAKEITIKPIEIYLIRHGKTYFNTTDQVQGWSDTH